MRSHSCSVSNWSQRGISLIELMVAMTIGLFLILGVTQIYIANQKSYQFQQSQVGNQENGRFTLALLEQELSKAGYRSLPRTQLPANSAIGCTFGAGTSVQALSATSLCIQYQARNRDDVTCLGTSLASTDQSLIAQPYGQANPVIVEKIAFDSTNQVLTCTVGTSTQQLATGIADIRFDYGYGPVNSRTVTGFSATPATTVGAVRYAALMKSAATSSIVDTSTSAPAALTEWNTRYSASITGNTQVYEIVQSTIMLRNQMP